MEGHLTVDKSLSYKILNSPDETDVTLETHVKWKISKRRNFKFKKLMNELPTMEKLKIRKPILYHADWLCSRCNKKKETLTHIWECSYSNNQLVIFERTTWD